ncbi:MULTISPECIES: hypothetical protein [unclassified Microbacterium]|uniref:hypothetical protein n=1 Tax=unclassified Microbacterium TaxID=2609290 RepID=UPI00214CC236|nr:MULTISPECIES: hypothetical protein [unclassified Microbacterium]MCR2784155.1 hypothetical protein [Microbacterium sp. zg.B96]WIM15010.1 hypothetical protein QNO11_10660 [Microbacterium sp. zg-B96]
MRRTFVALAALSVAGLIALVALMGTGVLGPFMNSALAADSESRSTQMRQAITTEEQVVLVSLGIQGIEEESANSSFFGMEIPGSDRASFLRYEFTAKLGLEGADVDIEQTAENDFLISIPEFIFIGHEFISDDGSPFKVVVQSNGALSWVTPEIDDTEMINRVLSDPVRLDYIHQNRALLQEQARTFYSGIVHGVDPSAELTFDFH